MLEYHITPQDEIKLLNWLDAIRPFVDLDVYLQVELVLNNAILRKKITDIEINEIISMLESPKNKVHSDSEEGDYNEHTVRERHVPKRVDDNRNIMIYQSEVLRFKHYLQRRYLKRQMALPHIKNKR